MSTQKYLCMHRGAPSQNKPSPAQMEVCADQRGVIQKTRGEGRIGHLKKESFFLPVATRPIRRHYFWFARDPCTIGKLPGMTTSPVS
jgi:hypothetical protein